MFLDPVGTEPTTSWSPVRWASDWAIKACLTETYGQKMWKEYTPPPPTAPPPQFAQEGGYKVPGTFLSWAMSYVKDRGLVLVAYMVIILGWFLLISPWKWMLWVLIRRYSATSHTVCLYGELEIIILELSSYTPPELVLLNLCKQCRSRSVGFFRSQLIWIYTVCHSVCEFISAIWIM